MNELPHAGHASTLTTAVHMQEHAGAGLAGQELLEEVGGGVGVGGGGGGGGGGGVGAEDRFQIGVRQRRGRLRQRERVALDRPGAVCTTEQMVHQPK